MLQMHMAKAMASAGVLRSPYSRSAMNCPVIATFGMQRFLHIYAGDPTDKKS